jgi:hypothetical protein
LQSKISQFWTWFQQNEQHYRELTDVQAAKEAMDNHILDFGLFSWEIGEGTSRPHYFVISPNGDAGRLELSRRIIEAAPYLRDWEFYYCRPPKNWDFKFEMYDRYLLKQQFDASNWEFALVERPENQIEIIIKTDNLETLDMDDELDAGDFAITQILGEELVIEYLEAFEMVTEFRPEHPTETYKMPQLKHQFEKMIR